MQDETAKDNSQTAAWYASHDLTRNNELAFSSTRTFFVDLYEYTIFTCTTTWLTESTAHVHSGQTTGHSREHARDLNTSGQFPSSSHKIPRSTSATRAISVLSSIILPLQTFFSRVLLLKQQPFASKNLPPERPTTTIAIKTQVFMFRYESVNSTGKFTIVAEIVFLLKKIYKRDAPFRAVFKVKTLAVLFSAYPREMKHIPRNLNLPPFWRCLFLW